MIDKFEFTPEERSEALQLISELKERVGDSLLPGDEQKIRSMLRQQTEQQQLTRDAFGLNPVVTGLQTALILVDETGLKRDAVVAILLYNSVVSGFVDIDEYLYNLFTTDGAYNQQNYSNPEVDELLEKGRVTIDETERKEIYKEAQKLIAEDAPMAFLYMNSFTVAMRSNVYGYTVHPTAATIFMKDVYFE